MTKNYGNKTEKYQYWLSNIEGIGPATIRKLLQYAGSAEELYFLPDGQIMTMVTVGEAERRKLIANRRWWDMDAAWERFLRRDILFLSQEMETFPEQLRHIDNAPYSIYIKGTMPKQVSKSVAIVGARRCSEYGRMMAEKLACALAECGVLVISGMAKGVDSYAHIGALKGRGKTYAVLGCGVDVCYPAENRRLYEEILQTGALISEYPPQMEPRAQLFPARNRIISAFCDTLVIIEAKEKSGSLITAEFAIEQGKDVFACPGRATDALSFGCNNLIRQGAGIVTSVESFLKDLGICSKQESIQQTLFEKFTNLSLEKDERLVYSCLDFRPKSLEELSYRTGIKTQYLTELTQGMIEKGAIKEIFRNYYIRAEGTPKA